ncbi:SDR family oxidoreductase [Nannocystis bainbridge]|uniref:Peroxisomal trans-2-enoyl-CoA reductase n=1 Tax=Nannocystis bainbridge TaxID=2995303 RepID=A0ABT5DWR5_9BACT|nr:SDR family oxidoreductase [Nannocystis bainbridge]MDC0716867.1 SDR family oxidoreductase [Nannocystis bainbridge]
MSGYRSVFRPGLFAGQTIVVTGGGSGIGRCTAHELAALGAHPVLVGRKLAKLEATAAEIVADGGACSLHACDIREEAQVKATVAAIVAARGRIDGLVNNAGGQFPAPLSAISQKGFETVVRTNLVGGFLFAREVYTQSMAERGGSIVNIVADMWRSMPGMGHSGAARAGMVNFTQTAAVEWAPSGVRVNAVAPGWIASSGMDNYDPDMLKGLLPRLKAAVPLHRLGTEAEVSAAIVFLLSEAAGFISGSTLRVDGAAPNSSAVWPASEHDRSKPYEGFHRAELPDNLR